MPGYALVEKEVILKKDSVFLVKMKEGHLPSLRRTIRTTD
jgi:hypothetical protein